MSKNSDTTNVGKTKISEVASLSGANIMTPNSFDAFNMAGNDMGDDPSGIGSSHSDGLIWI